MTIAQWNLRVINVGIILKLQQTIFTQWMKQPMHYVNAEQTMQMCHC